MAPENRYEHIGVSGGVEGEFRNRAIAPKRKAEVRVEPLMYLFGGSRVVEQGYVNMCMDYI